MQQRGPEQTKAKPVWNPGGTYRTQPLPILPLLPRQLPTRMLPVQLQMPTQQLPKQKLTAPPQPSVDSTE